MVKLCSICKPAFTGLHQVDKKRKAMAHDLADMISELGVLAETIISFELGYISDCEHLSKKSVMTEFNTLMEKIKEKKMELEGSS